VLVIELRLMLFLRRSLVVLVRSSVLVIELGLMLLLRRSVLAV
jgi:hypothetical protein